MDRLYIIGCGIAADDLTKRAEEVIARCDSAVLQTERMPAHKQISALREVLTCDELYRQAQDFDALAETVCDFIFSQEGSVCYCVMGSGLDDTCAAYALKTARSRDIPVQVIPGVSLADSACACCGYTGAMVSFTAFELMDRRPDPKNGLCVTSIDDALLAGRVKCRLTEIYDDEQKAYFCIDGVQSEIMLCELDRQGKYNHTACLVIEPVPFEKLASYNTGDLLDIMARLRGFDGCPWDREQTHRTLVRYLIEEAYEVADAVEKRDDFALADELGDVLLQVVFHAQIGAEYGEFDYHDVVNAICRKMIKRHPHIFADVQVSGSAEVLTNWESIKRKERGQSDSDVLLSVPRSFPALMRAEKVGDKARHAGFDFADVQEALKKLEEETKEFAAELDRSSERQEEEFGDLLFAAVNVARKCGIQPELALNRAADKFVRRFCAVETAAEKDGRHLRELDMEQFDRYWETVKLQEKK